MSIDTERLEHITDGDIAVKRELLELYFQTVERNMPVLQNLSDANDYEWREAIHEVKGASNTLGFDRMGSLCRQVELMPELKQIGKQAWLWEVQEAIAEIRKFADALGG